MIEAKLSAYNTAGELLVDIQFSCFEEELELEARQLIFDLIQFDSLKENQQKLNLDNCDWFINGKAFHAKGKLVQTIA